MARESHGPGRWLMMIVGTTGILLAGRPTLGQRTITADAYMDRLRGMWFGQLIGNHTGRPFEGTYCTREAAPDGAFAWVIKTSDADPWTGDDDTNFEYLYLHCLQTHGPDPTCGQIQSEWDAHVSWSGIYIANLQAKYLMSHGFAAPETGTFRNNIYAHAIDSQITTESLGAMAPGILQWAVDTARTFGGVSNEGFSLHAAEFYAAMYAAAAFEDEVAALVALGQAVIPQSSRTWRAVQDVRNWYAEDLLDGISDWRETRRKIYDYYIGELSYGRQRGWFESTVNVAITTMAILYGAGDFEQTIRIAVLSGFDADCNPAAAGGLLGLMAGFAALPAELTGPATDQYAVLDRPGLPSRDTITGIAAAMRAVAEQVIVANGGTVAEGVYTLPDEDPVTSDPELTDPVGPTGLVAAVRNRRGTVTVAASIEKHNPLIDRDNLESIIDGITDVRYNGHVPYDTFDGDNTQPAGGDFYELRFPQSVRFDGLTFYEGDIRAKTTNGDPRVVGIRSGYFESLIVEVHTESAWIAAENLTISEPLDPFTFYQVIDLGFTSVWGDGIRIRGIAGGTAQATSIVELVAHGAVVASDLDGDDDVDGFDFLTFANCYNGSNRPPLAGCEQADADIDRDGDVDGFDFLTFSNCFNGANRLPLCP